MTPDPSRHSEQSEIVPAIADDDMPPFEHLSDPSLLDDWSRRAQISIYAHNSAEVYFSRLDGLVTGVLLGGVVLLGQIALVVSTDSGFPKAVTAALTVVVAVIGALGLVWDFRTKATEHRFAARQYGAIRRALGFSGNWIGHRPKQHGVARRSGGSGMQLRRPRQPFPANFVHVLKATTSSGESNDGRRPSSAARQ